MASIEQPIFTGHRFAFGPSNSPWSNRQGPAGMSTLPPSPPRDLFGDRPWSQRQGPGGLTAPPPPPPSSCGYFGDHPWSPRKGEAGMVPSPPLLPCNHFGDNPWNSLQGQAGFPPRDHFGDHPWNPRQGEAGLTAPPPPPPRDLFGDHMWSARQGPAGFGLPPPPPSSGHFGDHPWIHGPRHHSGRHHHPFGLMFPFGFLGQPSTGQKKFQVTLDCQGYKLESIKTEVKDGKLIITGSEGAKADSSDGDYSLREFRKTYALPENADVDKVERFMDLKGKLSVEVPLKDSEKGVELPKIIENENGEKSFCFKLDLPKWVDTSKLSVTYQDHDLIINAVGFGDAENSLTDARFNKKLTLPVGTDFQSIKCVCENNQLSISAAWHEEPDHQAKTIRVEYKESD